MSLDLHTGNKAREIDSYVKSSAVLCSPGMDESIHTQSYGTFDEGVAAYAERLNTHGLFCFLSRCLPFFLHPSWWWHWHWLSVSVRACVVFARLWMLVPPLWLASVMSFVIWPRWCAPAILWFALPSCVRTCVHLSVCVPACCSMVASPWSVFLFSGSAAGAGGQALHHASQRWAAPERPGQTEEALWRRDCTSAGTQLSYDFQVWSHPVNLSHLEIIWPLNIIWSSTSKT